MHKHGIGSFKYHVGISSLDQVATRQDRVCVLNILGGESSDVTPVGHAYSGGNVVFGTSPGRRGQVLETPLGEIPVYNNVREGLEAGHRFNCGVVYLPPSGARDGVAELIRVNPDLRKIFIVTEKLSVHDSREIRALGQQNGVDIFGGNSLGVADAYHQVRIGGALGGDSPGEALKAGSVAIFSNSGNFTTTIATYLRMSGWGTTTLISSGKDVYIQYAAPEFAFALANDARSKAAVLYVEPGGYYELDAHFTKPVVACVVGRWKSRLSRAVGHAGAMAGGDDDAAAKERWFMEKFGVEGVFTPDNPVVSAKGAVVTNIAHIPAALTAVMRENGARPDFAPESSLALKPWFGSNAGLTLPAGLDLPVVAAAMPYGEQIARLNRQIGIVLPRQTMKDVSGASQMDPKTQVTSLHGVSMLEAARLPMEANLALALLREAAGENDRALINAAVAAEVNLHGRPELAAAEAAREAGNAPNVVLAAAASLVGPRRAETARRICRLLTDRFVEAGLPSALDESFDLGRVAADPDLAALLVGPKPDPRAEALLDALQARGARSVFLRYLRSLGGHPTRDAVLATVATTLAWGPLMRKRISRLTAESLPWWLQLFGVLLGAAVPAEGHEADSFCGVPNVDLLGRRTLGEIGCLALLGREGAAGDVFVFETLIGLLLSNGPGTISAQGCKGAVSADGPESPERVPAQQGGDRVPEPCGLRPRRQRLRGHRLPDRAVPRRGPRRPGRPGPRRRPRGARRPHRRGLRPLQDRPEECGQPRHPEDPGRQPPGLQGQGREPRPARGLDPRPARGARRHQRLPRLLPRPGAGPSRGGRVAHRLLREHRRGDRGAAPEDAVAALPGRRLLWRRTRDGGVHDLPVRPHARLRGGGGRSHEPRPQHGHAHARLAVPLRGLITRRPARRP
ncbi:CoA-binding protein [Methylobacterium sp. WSM2598]|uniref:CoA-binding protein n=1 Tax=Methylobacterium sp. WSM2598 TaxID=398261 RepID=UPI0003A5765B|nr:CoA-binding protein [Methylobacterium sp. WSM2598]